jgi:hypothetical protein
MKNKKSKMWLFNAFVCGLCTFAGVVCLINGNILFGIIDLVLAAANGVISVYGYINK